MNNLTMISLRLSTEGLPDDAPVIVEGIGSLWGYQFVTHTVYSADGKALVIQVSGHKSCAGTLR